LAARGYPALEALRLFKRHSRRARWQAEVAEQLGETDFGIVCVTGTNQAAPWLNFEAGALAKAVSSSRVIPLAIDLKPTDIGLPLGQFQGQEANEAGLRDVVTSLNTSSESPLKDELLDRNFKLWWPDLEEKLKKVGEITEEPSSGETTSRNEREILEEVLNAVRGLAARGPRLARPVERGLPRDHPS
jgi:hypothetical protein